MLSQDILFFVVIGFFFISVFYFVFFYKSKEEKEYDRKLKENLEDEFIIDPESGARITLEQAENGHWISHDNEYKTVPDSEIEKYLSEEEKIAERAINYLKQSRYYLKTEFSDDQIDVLDKTKTLSKYDGWSYHYSFSSGVFDGYILLPTVEIYSQNPTYFDNSYIETQIMFWLSFKTDFGHYYFREKSKTEKIFDLIKSDDEIKTSNYECFTFKSSENLLLISKILNAFQNQNQLEIEFLDNSLFIKNLKLVNKKDILRIENIIKNIVV